MIKRFYQLLGIDRAIGTSSANQLVRFFTAPVTMFLIIRYLSPEEQGFYYSFAGVVGIRVFLEAGFAVSITQFAAKEFAGLHFNQNQVLTGNPENLSRLRSIFQKSSRYYSAMGIILSLGLAGGGHLFFSSKSSEVDWQIPWLVVSVCAGFQFLLTPFWAILEGCDKVADVAIYRLGATIIGFFAAALGLYITQSIWVAVFGSVAGLLVAYGYIFLKWRKLLFQVKRKYYQHQQVGWRREIWAFQWKVALSWVSNYIIGTAIPALVFAMAGAVAAGQVGMTIALVRTGGNISSSWTATKMPRLASILAMGKFLEFEKVWRLAAYRSFFIAIIIQPSIVAGYFFLLYLLPGIALRFTPPIETILYAFGFIPLAIHVVLLHYTRASRGEPLLLANVFTALLFLILASILTQFYSSTGVALAFLISQFFNLMLSLVYFNSYRLSLAEKHSI
ncbi:MAG: hypothetical protein AAF649_00305 [Verrucomicrobiota bacterium]